MDKVHILRNGFVWTFAILNTIGDVYVGTEPMTYPLLGFAVAFTIAYIVAHWHGVYDKQRGGYNELE